MTERNKVYFPALDGIRFILIILVMSTHTEINYAEGFEGYKLQGLLSGKLAVDAFFVISGFLITYLLISEYEKNSDISLRGFYIKRFFRLFPVYFLVILVYLLVGIFVPGQEEIYQRTIGGFPYYFSFRNEFMPHDTYALAHTWSLSVEEKFYFVWPILFFKINFLKHRKYLFILGSLAFIPFYIDSKLYFSYLSILLGCGVAYCIKNKVLLGKDKVVGWLSKPFVGWGLLTVTLLCYYFVRFEQYVVQFSFSLAFAVLIVHLIYGKSKITGFFSHPLSTSMGMKAYSMYLFHMVFVNPVQNFLIKPVDNLSFLFCLFTSYLALAIFTYFLFHYFEKPFTNYGRKLSKNFPT